jgi:putative ABC transport system permease protein
MNNIFKIVRESIIQAIQQLVGNKLRSFLSLLGITIGIFCIIGVLSAVDSLEDNVRSSVEKLGNDVLFIDKFSWTEDPGANYFKIMRRPNIDFEDYEAMDERLRTAEMVAFQVGIGSRTVKWRNNSVSGPYLFTGTEEIVPVLSMEVEKGRFFSSSEYRYGSNKVVIGSVVAEELFGQVDPIGKIVKVNGRKMEVVGVFEKSGDSIININNVDEALFVPYNFAKKIANLKQNSLFGSGSLMIKGREGIPIEEVKAEVTGALRSHRRLQPTEESNFAINQMSILSNLLDGFFNVLNLVGMVIGGFAIFVGMFSVANIMFVSVKERTRIIGVKKALGAKQWIILAEFLIEAVILCIIGGLVGLVFIALILMILSEVINFDMYLSVANIFWGIGLSIFIGVLSGMIPALRASAMDPVDAMRS